MPDKERKVSGNYIQRERTTLIFMTWGYTGCCLIVSANSL